MNSPPLLKISRTCFGLLFIKCLLIFFIFHITMQYSSIDIVLTFNVQEVYSFNSKLFCFLLKDLFCRKIKQCKCFRVFFLKHRFLNLLHTCRRVKPLYKSPSKMCFKFPTSLSKYRTRLLRFTKTFVKEARNWKKINKLVNFSSGQMFKKNIVLN